MKVVNFQMNIDNIDHVISNNPDCKFFHVKHIKNLIRIQKVLLLWLERIISHYQF